MIATLVVLAQLIAPQAPESPIVTQYYDRLVSERGLFLQSGTGATLQTIEAKLRTLPVSVNDFGTACDGVTDKTTQIQAAIVAASSNNNYVVIPFNCVGTFTNPSDIPIIDLRFGKGGAASFGRFLSVLDYGADPTGVADSTSAFNTTLSSMAGTSGIIYIPPGTYLVNISPTRNGVTYMGAGRRSTILKPATNAPIITFDSTAGPLHSNAVKDVGFINTGTGFTSSAITITGTNINDWIQVQRVYFETFTGAITITGRCVWCRFIDGEVSNDASTNAGFYVNTSAPVNDMLIESWRSGNGAGDGFWFNATGGQVFKGINFHNANPEANTGNGIHLTNVDASGVYNSYIEGNGNSSATKAGVMIDGTFARGVSVRNNLIWGTQQCAAYWNVATLADGDITGNFLDTGCAPNETLHIATAHADSHLVFSGNYDTKTHNITIDGSGLSHVAFLGPLGIEYNSESAAPTSVSRKNMLRMTNGGAVTINNLTGGDVGQVLVIWQAGAGATTLTNGAGGAGQLLLPNAVNMTLRASSGDSIMLFYDGSNWRPMAGPNGSVYLPPDGGLVKHKRAAVGCTTGASVGATCTSGTMSWTTAFGDANYSMSCTLESPTGVPVVSSISRIAASFTITISALTAVGATGTYHCIAVHD